MTALDVLDATRWVTPALEILDARVQMSDPETGHLRTIVDTIADNAADAGIVTGGRAIRPDACDLRRVAAVLYVNETIEETGVAAGSSVIPPTASPGWRTSSHRTASSFRPGR